MRKFISIVEIFVLLVVNLTVMYGAALFAITGNGDGRGMKIVFGVGCIFIVAFALVDFSRAIKGRGMPNLLSLKAVPIAVGVLLVYVIGSQLLGVRSW
nr:hypothetical protein [uncultured Rhodoferax sp.]